MNQKENKRKIVVLTSGGMDSSTTMLRLANENYMIFPLLIKYDEKVAFMEEGSARAVISWLQKKGFPIEELKTTEIKSLQNLRKEGKVHTGIESFFPFRNLIFATIGALYGFTNNINNLALGLTKPAYPDCTPAFQEKLIAVLSESVGEEISVYSPFIHKYKADIVKYGASFGFPYEMTYSCYEGRKDHCGHCDGCKERKMAFLKAKIPDPTPEYESSPSL